MDDRTRQKRLRFTHCLVVIRSLVGAEGKVTMKEDQFADLVLDPSIRDWVVLPVIMLVLLINLLRIYLQVSKVCF